MSSCGCSPDHPGECTYVKIKFVDGTFTCEASEDCKQAIQTAADMWNEEAITNPLCFLAFELSKFQEKICINQQS